MENLSLLIDHGYCPSDWKVTLVREKYFIVKSKLTGKIYRQWRND